MKGRWLKTANGHGGRVVWLSKAFELRRYRGWRLITFIPPALLLTVGCSKADGSAEAADVDVSVVSALFAEGFNGETSAGQSTSGAPPGQEVALQDSRAGIPFDRSRSLTGRVENAMATNLGKDFSLRFAIADPEEFVRSGKVRGVWERELAARGYPADTVAGATALMFGVAWELSNSRKLSVADNAAILRQVTATLRGHQLERENDEQRQIQADIRLTAAGLWLEEAYLREPYPEQMRELSDAVHRDMSTMTSNDMRATSVTSEGFSD